MSGWLDEAMQIPPHTDTELFQVDRRKWIAQTEVTRIVEPVDHEIRRIVRRQLATLAETHNPRAIRRAPVNHVGHARGADAALETPSPDKPVAPSSVVSVAATQHAP